MGKTVKRKGAADPALKPKVTRAKSLKSKTPKPKTQKPKAAKPNKKPTRKLVVLPVPGSTEAMVMDRLWSVITSRRNTDPAISHSARLLSRGTAKVAQKFGEEAVEAIIEAVAGNRDALISESADVLYHLIVLWVAIGIEPAQVWEELTRREGVSGIAEKAARALPVALRPRTSKIP
jgi:phosphoribosyl-ATP pyrophosphohydrolase